MAVSGASRAFFWCPEWTTFWCPEWTTYGEGGVPAQLVPDNPKVGVTVPTGTSPGSTGPISTWRLSHYYGTAILPARPRSPARQGQG